MHASPPPWQPTRRGFVNALAIVPLGSTLSACHLHETPQTLARIEPPQRFLRQEEVDFVQAATGRLIPEDDLGPGAVKAGVPDFIDLQLASAYGRADRWYMAGPFPDGSDEQGWQVPWAPAEFYRVAIADIDAYCRGAHGKRFAELDDEMQDEVLHGLEIGDIKLERAPAQTFFKLLWQNTQQGFLADPVYGGNRDFAGWKLIGFPGPRYNYVDEITRYGQRYEQPFVSLAGRDPSRRLYEGA